SHAPARQGLVEPHCLGEPVQAPALQTSFSVQKCPSSQPLPSFAGRRTQAPFSQAGTWHASPTSLSQSAAFVHACSAGPTRGSSGWLTIEQAASTTLEPKSDRQAKRPTKNSVSKAPPLGKGADKGGACASTRSWSWARPSRRGA